MRRRVRLLIMLGAAGLISAAPLPAFAAEPTAGQAIAKAQAARKAKQYQPAIETLAGQIRKPGFQADPAAPSLLMTLAETAEAYVQVINDRYWQRSRLNPKSPSWLTYLRKEQRWAAKHYASFQYFDPRGRYRSDGDAYKLLVSRFPRHPLAEEAAWRLIPHEDDGEHDLSVDPALIDASRHERFLKQYPKSKYRLAAKLAIGWDYLYASGFTWGTPDRRRFEKGQRILQGIIQEAPQSAEAQKARRFLDKAKDPWR
ncbi:hypothetical protein J7643_02210 [bacterium]|nr:hypothetical protein [bacterium]